MSILIHVDAYSGYKANERPCQFTLDEEIYEIAVVLDLWYQPSAMYFKVRSAEGKTYLLRYDEETEVKQIQLRDPMSREGSDKRATWSVERTGRLGFVTEESFVWLDYESHAIVLSIWTIQP